MHVLLWGSLQLCDLCGLAWIEDGSVKVLTHTGVLLCRETQVMKLQLKDVFSSFGQRPAASAIQ